MACFYSAALAWNLSAVDNRGISTEEFGRAARERFMLLDANHDGLIRLDELPSLPSRMLRKSR